MENNKPVNETEKKENAFKKIIEKGKQYIGKIKPKSLQRRRRYKMNKR